MDHVNSLRSIVAEVTFTQEGWQRSVAVDPAEAEEGYESSRRRALQQVSAVWMWAVSFKIVAPLSETGHESACAFADALKADLESSDFPNSLMASTGLDVLVEDVEALCVTHAPTAVPVSLPTAAPSAAENQGAMQAVIQSLGTASVGSASIGALALVLGLLCCAFATCRAARRRGDSKWAASAEEARRRGSVLGANDLEKFADDAEKARLGGGRRRSSVGGVVDLDAGLGLRRL